MYKSLELELFSFSLKVVKMSLNDGVCLRTLSVQKQGDAQFTQEYIFCLPLNTCVLFYIENLGFSELEDLITLL